jgi:hypothetical protein
LLWVETTSFVPSRMGVMSCCIWTQSCRHNRRFCATIDIDLQFRVVGPISFLIVAGILAANGRTLVKGRRRTRRSKTQPRTIWEGRPPVTVFANVLVTEFRNLAA